MFLPAPISILLIFVVLQAASANGLRRGSRPVPFSHNVDVDETEPAPYGGFVDVCTISVPYADHKHYSARIEYDPWRKALQKYVYEDRSTFTNLLGPLMTSSERRQAQRDQKTLKFQIRDIPTVFTPEGTDPSITEFTCRKRMRRETGCLAYCVAEDVRGFNSDHRLRAQREF